MNTKTPVKIIKRGARQQEAAQQQQQSAPEETKKTAQQATRDVVATVAGWVNEFQQKRRAETTQALKTLFSDTTPQTSKA